MTIDVKSLGEAAIRALAEKTSEKRQPQALARQYVNMLTTDDPHVKLPAILTLAQTAILMEAGAVTRSHLRKALAAARKDIRETAGGAKLKPARRLRKSKVPASPVPSQKAGVEPAKAGSLADLFDDPLVPN